MLVKLAEEITLKAPPQEVWRLLRDTPRFAGLLPGVQEVLPVSEAFSEAYQAKATDRIGPFKVGLNLEIRIVQIEEPSALVASIKGGDTLGLNRVTGSLRARLAPAGSATHMHFEAEIEILGKLASLGAAAIRRRMAEKFAEFTRNIQTQFSGAETQHANLAKGRA